MKRYTTVQVDEMGRVKLHKLFCTSMGITHKTILYAYQDGDRIILSPSSAPCPLCGDTAPLIQLEVGALCPHCIEEIKAAAV